MYDSECLNWETFLHKGKGVDELIIVALHSATYTSRFRAFNASVRWS